MFDLLVLLAVVSVKLGTPSTIPTISEQIVGGYDVNIKDYPYQVSILYNGQHHCGGTIISDIWILTAAHCTHGKHPSWLTVRAGSSVINDGGQIVSISRIVNHGYYGRWNSEAQFDFDISLIQLGSRISDTHGRAIALVSGRGRPEAGATCTITGWGNTVPNQVSPSFFLQAVQLPIVSQEHCRNIYGQGVVTDRMFCAGLLGIGGKSTCHGDSGGPVVMNGMLVGIVSWGATCAHPYNPVVFTNVASLRYWIWQITRL